MSVNDTVVFHHKFTENDWLGGAHYFHNLSVVNALYNRTISVQGMDLNKCPTRYTGLFERVQMSWFNRVVHKVPSKMIERGRINFLEEKAQGKRICIYSTNVEHLSAFSKVPGIFWIPDFQVLHLPQFFTPDDIDYRKKSYAEGGRLSKLIVLSSESARKDLVTHYPDLANKARVMHFVSELPPEVFSPDSSYVCNKYSLPPKFFYVPNQYWQHKNHGLIIEAIKLLRNEIPELCVVFSGSKNDSRNPGYIEELRHRINSAGIDNNLFELGIVPKEDVYALMRHSCSIINVSRFEGWSTSVEEAKAIGKPIILSSIDVHIEQNPPEALYVSTDDHAQLADHMRTFWNKYPSGPSAEKEKMAREAIKVRIRSFAQCFEDIIEEACSIS